VGGSGLVLFEGFAGRGDFFSVGCEDDALDCVVVIGFEEGSGFEIEGAGAVGVGEGAGDGGLDAAFDGSEGDEVEVGLDGGAVLGEREREGEGEVVGIAATAAGVLAGLCVKAAVMGSVERGLGALAPGGKDVSAKLDHGLGSLVREVLSGISALSG